jgi:hypothetical protein
MSERRVRVVRLLGQDQERPLLRLLSLRQRRRRVGLWFCSSAPNTPSFTGSYIAEEGDGGWSLTRAFNNLSLLTASPSMATKDLVLFGRDLDLVALAQKSAAAIIVDGYLAWPVVLLDFPDKLLYSVDGPTHRPPLPRYAGLIAISPSTKYE